MTTNNTKQTIIFSISDDNANERLQEISIAHVF